MIVLGIDPGTATTGWGVVTMRKTPEFVDCGVIVTQAKQRMPHRLAEIYSGINNLIKTYQPEVCALEEIFFSANVKTALLVGQARGVVLLAIQKRLLPVFSYTPLQVKLAVAGYGRASKIQMQKMVKNLLTLPQIPKPDDAADALAIALTHCFSNPVLK